MKIYCILLDTAPLHSGFVDFAKKNNASLSYQISNSHTASSVLSMLTGKNPSDLEGEEQSIHKSWFRNQDSVYSKSFTWNKDTITERLLSLGWEVNFHNSHTIIKDVCSHPDYTRTTAYPGGLKKEESLWWDHQGIISATLGNGQDSESFYMDEVEHIKFFQKPSEKNQFNFVLYHQHHMAEQLGNLYDVSYDRLNWLLSNWDLDEPDSLFYIFSDHGLYKKINRYQNPPYSWYTWAIVKNNINDLKPKPLVAISDFKSSIEHVLGLETSSENSIFENLKKDRTYFIEDSRFSVDDMRTTTFASIRAYEWDGDNPTSFVQTSYHKPEEKFINYFYNTKAVNSNVDRQYNGNVEILEKPLQEHVEMKKELEEILNRKGII